MTVFLTAFTLNQQARNISAEEEGLFHIPVAHHMIVGQSMCSSAIIETWLTEFSVDLVT